MASTSVVVATSVATNQARFTPGLIPDQRPVRVVSKNVETVAGIGFGLAVSQGTGEQGCVLTGTGAENFIGITVVDQGAYSPTGDDTVPQNSQIAVLQEGSVVVTVAVAVVAGEAAYAVTADGTFTNVATGNIDINGVFETAAGVAGLAVVRLK